MDKTARAERLCENLYMARRAYFQAIRKHNNTKKRNVELFSLMAEPYLDHMLERRRKLSKAAKDAMDRNMAAMPTECAMWYWFKRAEYSVEDAYFSRGWFHARVVDNFGEERCVKFKLDHAANDKMIDRWLGKYAKEASI